MKLGELEIGVELERQIRNAIGRNGLMTLKELLTLAPSALSHEQANKRVTLVLTGTGFGQGLSTNGSVINRMMKEAVYDFLLRAGEEELRLMRLALRPFDSDLELTGSRLDPRLEEAMKKFLRQEH